MWYRVVPFTASHTALNWTGEAFAVAAAATPEGPFRTVQPHAYVQQGSGGDFSVYVDANGGVGAEAAGATKAYILYTAHSTDVRIVVEELDANFYNSRKDVPATPPFPPQPVEAPAMFKRGDWYYVTFGHTCCYCLAGSDVDIYASAHPLGPYVALGNIGLNSDGACCVTRAQQNYVAAVGGGADSGQGTLLWTGTRWGSAPDGLFVHSFQTWLPLVWEDDGQRAGQSTPPRPLNLTWVDAFELDV